MAGKEADIVQLQLMMAASELGHTHCSDTRGMDANKWKSKVDGHPGDPRAPLMIFTYTANDAQHEASREGRRTIYLRFHIDYMFHLSKEVVGKEFLGVGATAVGRRAVPINMQRDIPPSRESSSATFKATERKGTTDVMIA
ncbi:hypothetical protein NPIL_664951 [Nephila pilipes]|uniref:Uncharacterized protein n=1 Tax=Nephila pilipes TaxID=299642 RepID=A0A8X6QJM2_NEPPI|nr:hypothetical protein NPIL_664951 [Nephila pilipes]